MKQQISEKSVRCDWCAKPNIKKGMTFWRNEKENVNVCKNCGDKGKSDEYDEIYAHDDWRDFQ